MVLVAQFLAQMSALILPPVIPFVVEKFYVNSWNIHIIDHCFLYIFRYFPSVDGNWGAKIDVDKNIWNGIMVKIDHFVSCISRGYPHCINHSFAKHGMIKKRAIMVGPIFDPVLQHCATMKSNLWSSIAIMLGPIFDPALQ